MPLVETLKDGKVAIVHKDRDHVRQDDNFVRDCHIEAPGGVRLQPITDAALIREIRAFFPDWEPRDATEG